MTAASTRWTERDIEEAQACLVDVVGAHVALRKAGGELVGLCPFHAERTPSFHVVPAKGFFHCFGCGAHGDAVDFMMEIGRLPFRDAVAEILGRHPDGRSATNGHARYKPRPLEAAPDPYAEYIPIFPVPAVVEPLEPGRAVALLNPKRADDAKRRVWRATPSMVFPYRDASGALLGYVLRVDFENGGKVTPQVTWCRGPDGKEQWCARPFQAPRPLYGLDRLAAMPGKPVLVCEGEKAVEAARRLLPASCVIGWPGGTGGVAHVDWSPLAGRRVMIMPDNDRQGLACAIGKIKINGQETPGLARILLDVGAADVLVVDASECPGGKGGDAADIEAAGWTGDEFRAWLSANACRPDAWAPVAEPEAAPEPEAPPGPPERGTRIGPLLLRTVDDAKMAPARPYLVKHLIVPGEFSCWLGEPAAGKTFVLLHIAYAIAQGREVFRRRVRQAPVLYLGLEGEGSFEKRIDALERRFGPADAFRYHAGHFDLMADGDGAVKAIVEAAEKTGAQIIVVDTLSRAMPGRDENAPEDMTAFVGRIDRIRAATGAHVAVAHHPTKTNAAVSRGHGSLHGAVDLEVHVAKDEDGTRELTTQKNRDGEAGRIAAYEMEVVELGRDEDGDAITTCTVTETARAGDDVAKAKKRDLTENQAGWLRDLMSLFATDGLPQWRTPASGMRQLLTLTRDQVRDGMRQAGRFTENPDGNLTSKDREKLSNALNTLRDKGKIGMNDRFVWVIAND